MIEMQYKTIQNNSHNKNKNKQTKKEKKITTIQQHTAKQKYAK